LWFRVSGFEFRVSGNSGLKWWVEVHHDHVRELDRRLLDLIEGLRVSFWGGVQGYLAHKRPPPPLGPPYVPRHRPTVGSQGGAVTCKRGHPVGFRVWGLGSRVSGQGFDHQGFRNQDDSTIEVWDMGVGFFSVLGFVILQVGSHGSCYARTLVNYSTRPLIACRMDRTKWTTPSGNPRSQPPPRPPSMYGGCSESSNRPLR